MKFVRKKIKFAPLYVSSKILNNEIYFKVYIVVWVTSESDRVKKSQLILSCFCVVGKIYFFFWEYENVIGSDKMKISNIISTSGWEKYLRGRRKNSYSLEYPVFGNYVIFVATLLEILLDSNLYITEALALLIPLTPSARPSNPFQWKVT